VKTPRIFICVAGVCAGLVDVPSYAQERTLAPIEPISTAGALVELDEEDFFAEDGEVILSVNLRGELLLSDAIIATVEGEDLYLPFEEIMFLVEFPIRVLEGNERAEGWFIRPDRQFTLDGPSGTVVSDGRSLSFDPSLLRVLDGELHVPVRLIMQWLPLDFGIDLRALNLRIMPREPIAIDERIIRSNRALGTTFLNLARLEERPTPYRLFGIPAFGFDLAAGLDTQRNEDLFGTYNIRADGDLLWTNASAVVFGNNDDVTDARIRLARENPRGGLLGRLDATLVEVGDVNGVSAALINESASGRGIRISRRPTGFAGILETIVLEGPIEPGFEVELYRNDILIDVQNPSGTQYRFEDVLLLGGRNVMRFEFYGPQGQRRTETEQFFTGATQARTGKFLYDFAVTQPGETVFGVRDARVDYGVNARTTATAGAFFTPLEGDEDSRGFATAGIRSTVGPFFVTGDTAVDTEGGIALGASASFTEERYTISAGQKLFLNGFLSRESQFIVERERVSETTLDVTAFSRDLIEGAFITGSVGTDVNVFDDGDTKVDVDTSVNVSTRNISFGNDLFFDDIGGNEQVNGSARVNWKLNDFRFRASADYEITPDAEFRTASARVSKTFADGYDANLGYFEDFTIDTRNVFASVTKDFGVATAGVFANYQQNEQSDDDVSIFLTLSFSSFTDQETLDTTFRSDRVGGRSAISARVFLDENQNGIREPNEALLPDIVVRAGRRAATTDENGRALLLDSRRTGWTDVVIDPESLSDPAFRPGKIGFAVLPRPGVSATLDLPVLVTADVEGFVRLRRGEDVSPLTNVTVQAVNQSGEVIASGQTAFDGLYVIDGIPIGQYSLRVDPVQAQRLGVEDAPEIELTLRREDGVVEGQDFDLNRFSGEQQ